MGSGTPFAQERQLEIEDLLDRNEELEAWNVEFQHGQRCPLQNWAEKSRLVKFLEFIGPWTLRSGEYLFPKHFHGESEL